MFFTGPKTPVTNKKPRDYTFRIASSGNTSTNNKKNFNILEPSSGNSSLFSRPNIEVIIRGHIREAFSNNDLRDFIMVLKETYNTRIFIHTWAEKNGSRSWKENYKFKKNKDLNEQKKQDTTPVTINMIEEYFINIELAHIMIENDQNLTLVGQKDGLICKSLCPIIAWKNMWAGRYNLIHAINNLVKPDSTVLEFRFDLFSISNSCNSLFTVNSVYEKCKNLKTSFMEDKPKCFSTRYICGLDNFMIGSFKQLFDLITWFHTDLDNIIALYPNVEAQEFLVLIMINRGRISK